MTYANIETLDAAAAHAATVSSCPQKPSAGLRLDESNALARRCHR